MSWNKNMSAEEKANWAVEQKQKLANAEEMLKNGVADIYNSEKYSEYLKFYSGFHNYSITNTILILLQNPAATRCASYADWKKKGRQVRKGEKGMLIRVPTLKKFKIEDEDGNEKEIKKLFFKTGTTFDISQTDGDPIPEICHQLNGDIEEYNKVIEVIRKVSPVSIDFEEFDNGAYGYYSIAEDRIVIKKGIPQQHAVKTSIHETAHAILHRKGGSQENADRSTKELQAESVAFIVCNYLGIDTSEYSFGYVAGWSNDKTGKQLEKNLTVIGDTAMKIINLLENLD